MSSDQTQLFADDLTIGQKFGGEPRTVGDAAFKAFADFTGDDHPIHYDDAYAAKTRFGKRLAHGLLVMSMTAFGATAMSHRFEDSMVAFLDQAGRFIKPVFVDDVLTSHFVVASIARKPGRDSAVVRFDVTLTNQAGDVVLQGHHVYMLLCKSAASSGLPHAG
ncbi:MaoC family dehydratase N-terminal domain-containing protein [Bradyrhizobium lablabi]|uniref:MaoC family dehydratase n=1 Tax=Bradyrhizobium lablabi TaxID=722472 RepID=UPI001BA5A1A8|nr:MaoC family dehydratase N-terminal domain-containing protein [Bradyrhizobium lablabi]